MLSAQIWCYCQTCSTAPEGRIQQILRTQIEHRERDEYNALFGTSRHKRLVGDPDLVDPNIPPVDFGVPDRYIDSFHYSNDASDSSDDPDDEDVHRLLPRNTPSEYIDDFSDSSSDTSDLDPLDDQDEGVNIVDDPLFTSRGRLYDPPPPDPGDDDDDEEPDLPKAFYESPAIRNAYVHAFLQATFHGATHTSIQAQLEANKVLLDFAQRLTPNSPIPGLGRMALTLPTVLKRLGLSTDDFITYFFICDTCWELHHPSELTALASPACTAADCSGNLYTTKRLNDNSIKRTPITIVPYVDPKRFIQHMFMRPGKFDQLQEWRGPSDQPGPTPPSPARGYDAFEDPSKPMYDIHDGWEWRAIQAGMKRIRTGRWTIKDVTVNGLLQRFVTLPCGLVWQINIDWFQAIVRGNHSTGAVYMTCCNNPRGIRYLVEETALIMVIPGDHEPTLEQLNKLLEPLITSLIELGNGVEFRVYAQPDPALSHSHMHTNVSDLPASRKTSGLMGHNAKYFMCHLCATPFYMLTDADGFNPNKFKMRSEWRYLKYAYRSRDADPAAAIEIEKERGVRWAETDRLPGWMPGCSSVIEFAHCVYLGMVRHVTKDILYKTGMFNAHREYDPLPRIEAFFESVIWPFSVSRLPPSVARGGGSAKADQWRSQISVLFVALFVAWEVDGEIPDIDAPPSTPNTKIYKAQERIEALVRKRRMANFLVKNPDPSEEEYDEVENALTDRNYRTHYDAILEFSTAIRILSSRSISPNEVKRGSTALTRACQEWARMNCHLVPYFHLANHFEDQFLRLGPCYAWWALPYERNNGVMGRFNHNGHSGGELEGTMMRRWYMRLFIHELITGLEAIPNPTPEDLDSIKSLKAHLKGGTKERRGTLANFLAQMNAENNREHITFPPASSKQVVLRTLGAGFYRLVFEYLKSLWPDLDLHSDISIDTPEGGSNFLGNITSFAFFLIQRQRYGAAHSRHGFKARYAYIDSRLPVEIQYIWRVTQDVPNAPSRTANFAVVRPFQKSPNMPDFPWDFRAVDLGVDSWIAGMLGDLRIVPLEEFSGQLILAPITVCQLNLWITIAFNHYGTEPEDAEDNEGNFD